MKIDFIELLQADSVVSDGLYFKAVTNWWDIVIILVITISLVIYLKKRKRK
jgi:hypothetical protein